MALARQYVEKDFYTEAEYFALEGNAFEKSEYVEGRIRMMAGGSTDHGAIAANIIRLLGNALIAKGCRIYSADVKIHCGDGANIYPDVSVVCGPPALYGGRRDTYTNPLVIVEVLSASTEKYDQGEKFDHYQTISSLTDYLLVTQDEAHVMLYTRQNDHWDLREAVGMENSIFLPSVDVTLALDDIYALIEFAPDGSAIVGQ